MLKKLLAILSIYFFTLACGEIHESELRAYQLSDATYPESYEIDLTFQSFDTSLPYNGFVTINIKIQEDTNIITLHSSVFNVTKVTYVQETRNIELNCTQDRDQELLIIKSPENEIFQKNTSVTIEIKFIGAIKEFPTTQGVYRGFYVDENSVKHYFMASYLQSNYARKVFPCYDDSRFESTFNLIVTHEDKYQTVSNMDKFTDESIPELRLNTRTFEPTSSIPAHSLIFFISDLAVANKLEFVQNGMKFRALSQPSLVNKTNFGFSTATQASDSVQKYFGAAYASKSLDLVILPQFDFDGIKNSGVIFYREDSFLYDENEHTAYDKELVSRNIVNKFCQIFLKSSLTTGLESSQWLNKGLCKFYEYHLSDSIHEEMKLNDIFAVEVLQPELSRDSSPTTTLKILNNKAANLIRMFHHALSEETFRNGVQIYINKGLSNPEHNLEPMDFYYALQESVNDSKVDIAKMFQTWETQAGYPIVYVTRNYNTKVITFTQKRFIYLIENGTTYDGQWSIPLTFTSNAFQNSLQLWMHNKEWTHTISDLKSSDYFIVNVDQTGYYRVMYDEANWVTIAKALYEQNFENISPNTRGMLINDAGKFMQMEILEMEIFLDIIKYLQHEIEYIPLMSATGSLLYMKKMLNDGSSKLFNDFQIFLRTLFTKAFETYGVEKKDKNEHQQKHIRNLAINWACQAHLPACLSETAELFNQGIMNSDVFIPPDHRATIMCNGVITGNYTQFNFLWNLYTNNKPSEKSIILKSIGCIEDQEILSDYIRRYNKVADDEWLIVIQAVYMNGPVGLNVAMEFLNEKTIEFGDFIYKHSAADSLDLIFQQIADRIVTDEMSTNFTKLMDKYNLSRTTKALLEAVVKKNLEWIKKNSPIIDQFLNSSKMVAVSLTAILLGFFVQYFVR